MLCMLQKLLDKCEQELIWLGMSINVKKSCCMRVGPRCDAVCANITTGDGRQLPWVKEIRYLGIHIVQSRHFKSATFWEGWSDSRNRRSNIATCFLKCIPVLLYGLESVLSLTLSDVRSLDFTLTNRLATCHMMKLLIPMLLHCPCIPRLGLIPLSR